MFCSDVPDIEVVVPAEQLRARMIEARALGATAVEFSGLEPTLRADFVDLVREARHLGYQRIQVITNGRRFADREFARAAVQAGLNSVLVSIHGDSAALEASIVGTEQSWTEKRAGIENLQAAFLATRISSKHHAFAILETNVVVTSANVDHLDPVVSFLAGLGIARINLYAARPFGWGNRNFDAAIPPIAAAGTAAVAAARRARKMGTPAFVCDFPPCVLGDGADLAGSPEDKEVIAVLKSGKEQRLEGLTKKAIHKTKGAPCETCAVEPACEGVYREYVRRRGWSEIRAIPRA